MSTGVFPSIKTQAKQSISQYQWNLQSKSNTLEVQAEVLTNWFKDLDKTTTQENIRQQEDKWIT